MNFSGKKFVASYSGGKDSILAIYRALKMGMTPVSLIITYNKDKDRSWFHGIPKNLIDEVSRSVNIPIKLIETTGAEYAERFKEELTLQKGAGAEVCVFGDIDIEDHLKWGSDICKKVGIMPCFPLWQESRSDLVHEFIDSGFTANITVVDTERLSEKHLGLELTNEVIKSIVKDGADACGENGEYHTFVSNGPLFDNPVSFLLGEKIYNDKYIILPIIKL